MKKKTPPAHTAQASTQGTAGGQLKELHATPEGVRSRAVPARPRCPERCSRYHVFAMQAIVLLLSAFWHLVRTRALANIPRQQQQLTPMSPFFLSIRPHHLLVVGLANDHFVGPDVRIQQQL